MITTPSSTTSGGLRRTRKILLAAVTGAAVVILTAPLVQAARMSENEIKDRCNGLHGTYNSYVAPDGRQYSYCCYKVAWNSAGAPIGQTKCEYYIDGNLQEEAGPVNANPPGGPSTPPPGPPGNEMAPPATAVNPG